MSAAIIIFIFYTSNYFNITVGKSCPIDGRTHHAVFDRLLSHHLAADMIMLLFDIILIINNGCIGYTRSTRLREEALESDNIIIICYPL